MKRSSAPTLQDVVREAGVTAMTASIANLDFLEVLNGILEAAARHGQNMTLFSVSDWEGDEDRILRFCDGRVDGMIFIGPHPSAPFAEALDRYAPFVTLHAALPLPGIYRRLLHQRCVGLRGAGDDGGARAAGARCPRGRRVR